jgi:hypothetical protein
VAEFAGAVARTLPWYGVEAARVLERRATITTESFMSDIDSRLHAGPRSVYAERRRRNRLRDLCDEVLASFRIAADRDPISEQDRAIASEMLKGLAVSR